MKSLTSLTLGLIFSVTLLAQKVDEQSASFDYKQLPTKPLDKAITNYSSKVILAYEEQIKQEIAQADAEYAEAMAEHPAKVAAAKKAWQERMDQYEYDMKAWDDKSTASKLVEKHLLEENNKPVKPADFYPPAEPRKRIVEHQKIFSPSLLESTYLKLDGYKKAADNALKITVTMYGFQNLEPELKQKESSVYSTQTKSTTKVITYWYETAYKHPMQLKVELPNGQVLVNETFDKFNEYTIEKSAETKGSTPPMNKQQLLESLQNKIVENNMQVINQYLNDNYGYSTKKRETTIYRVETKKVNYDEYQNAFEAVMAGYNNLVFDMPKAQTKIGEAIKIWESDLAESNTADKKARINEEITLITLFDLIEAHIWMNNYDQAETYINKAVALKLNKKEQKAIDDYRAFLNDQKIRFRANN